jgi:hypothetical protein
VVIVGSSGEENRFEVKRGAIKRVSQHTVPLLKVGGLVRHSRLSCLPLYAGTPAHESTPKC